MEGETRDIPIIFSAPMVRALIDGRKTMTRRLASATWRHVRLGDRLWVREAGRSYFKRSLGSSGWIYRADCNEFTGNKLIHQTGANEIKWTPSIHMPRWASRITLTVIAAKVERLNIICHNDLLREGVYQAAPSSWTTGDNIFAGSAYAAFRGLWNRLHGERAWDANPEVVALTFTVALRNIDAKEAA